MTPEPAPSWQGFYVGLDLGYAFQSGGKDPLKFDTNLDNKYGDTVLNSDGTPAFESFCHGDADCSRHRGGVDVGARAGYDWQFDNFVVGALLEADYADVKDEETGFTASNYYTMGRKLNFLGAGRLRAGVLVDPNWLVYATGGVAYGNIDHSFSTSNTDNAFATSGDKGGWGWQLGGGVETKITPDISLGVEYLYTSLDDKDYVVRVSQGNATATDPFVLADANGTDIQQGKDRFNIQSVRATLTYHFDGM